MHKQYRKNTQFSHPLILQKPFLIQHQILFEKCLDVKKLGYNVLIANCGNSAVELYIANKDKIDSSF